MDPFREEAELAALRTEHPAFRVWAEVVRDRRRYIAQRIDREPGLWAAMTGCIPELRAVLRDSQHQPGTPGRPGLAG